MPDLRTVVRFAGWLLPPSSWKNWLLRRLGDEVSADAVVAPTIVWRVGRIWVADEVRVGYGNQFRNLRSVELGRGARVGNRNVVSSHPVYAKLYPDGARLQLGARAVVTDRHHLDAAGGLSLGEFSMLGGRGTHVLTHSIDLDRDVQSAYPVTVGARSYVDGGALLLGGAVLPPRSLLTAGSVLVRARSDPMPGTWAGAPARAGAPVTDPWFSRVSNTEPASGPDLTNLVTPDHGDRAPERRRHDGGPRPIDLARAVVWLLPASPQKNALLRRLGHDIHSTARATANLVWRVAEFSMAEGSRIAEFNRITDVRSVRLGRRTTIGRWNRVWANVDHPTDGGSLVLGDHTQLTGRHRVDATGNVWIGNFGIVAGRETSLMSGRSDLEGQGPAPVRVGARSFVGTRCRLTAGAVLADRSVLAAGSTLAALPPQDLTPGVWAGSPARHRRPVSGRWFDREQTSTRRVFVPSSGATVEDAF